MPKTGSGSMTTACAHALMLPWLRCGGTAGSTTAGVVPQPKAHDMKRTRRTRATAAALPSPPKNTHCHASATPHPPHPHLVARHVVVEGAILGAGDGADAAARARVACHGERNGLLDKLLRLLAREVLPGVVVAPNADGGQRECPRKWQQLVTVRSILRRSRDMIMNPLQRGRGLA